MDYPYIRAWCQLMGSYSYWTKDQVQMAKRENAPKDAIYRDHEGRWHTLGEVNNEVTKWRIEDIVEKQYA